MLTKLLAKLGYIKKPEAPHIPDPVMTMLLQRLSQGGLTIKATNLHTGEVIEPEERPDMPPSLVKGGWTEYADTMLRASVDGWAFGRMGCYGPDETVTFYFGNLRGDFGVFTINTPVCYTDPTVMDVDDQPVLAQLVHLPTGCGLGVFENRYLACRAGEVLEASGLLPYRQPLPYAAWMQKRENIINLWGFHGIGESDHWHAHPPGAQGGVSIYATIAADAGKPEKVS